MKRKRLLIFCFFFTAILFAQEVPAENGGREIENLISAVKEANPGDYIVLPSGRHYVLSREEIDVANGNFDFSDLSGVKTEILDNGVELKIISESHAAYIYPDGQSVHILKTSVSFTEFMQQHIEKNYFLGTYVDIYGNFLESKPNGSPKFYVFRASVQFQTISDGSNEAETVIITAYNYRGENFVMRYFSTDESWFWGNIRGNYAPAGEARQIEFDIE